MAEISNLAAVAAYSSLMDALRAVFGGEVEITEQKRVYGGDINDAYELRLSGGQRIFMKTNQINNYRFFETEAQGLEALRSACAIGVPQLLGIGTDRQRGFSFLLLEYMESASPIKDYWEVFGQQLAQMHRADCMDFVQTHLPEGKASAGGEARYGFVEDNYIGATVQKNTSKGSWIEFYRDCRLLPQIKMADRYFDSGLRKKLDRLLSHLDSYIREPEFPSLVHGDLWGGNVLCGNDGRAWLIDPAAYVGDFETDLAMTELFGRFPQTFYEAYHEVNPVENGYRQRKKIYQLYHLLNHLNLFGRSYLGSVAAVLEEL